MPKSLRSYKVFKDELEKVAYLYKVSYSFLRNLHDSSYLDKPEVHMTSKEIETALCFKIGKRKQVGYRAAVSYTLRELIYVRLITALEVFLVDSVKIIFSSQKNVFKDNEKNYSLSQAELLSFQSISDIRNKIINKVTRELSSGGYKQIVKYYRKQFEIELNEIPPGARQIEKYHDVRHILVHRNGHVDDSFRKKYNYRKKGISISDETLLGSV